MLLGVMTTALQNAWRADRNTYEEVATLAQWAVEKKTKLMMIKNLQVGREPEHKATPTTRNPNGIY